MKSKLAWAAAGQRVHVVVLDPGEEAFAVLTRFAADCGLTGASIVALGAFERAVVGWFDLRTRGYRPTRVDEQCEALSLLGDIAAGDDGKPSVHLHAVLGLADGTTRGGHFLEGIVQPTLEVTITETPAHLRRIGRPELGIALIDLDAGQR
ncbi:MAG: DNA-binding protein [Enhydrobacter sp.]|nr:MAG: DNA-binding protein [Enhydrobacter sp.]